MVQVAHSRNTSKPIMHQNLNDELHSNFEKAHSITESELGLGLPIQRSNSNPPIQKNNSLECEFNDEFRITPN